MRYFITKTEKPATKTTTFNMTEEALAVVKETMRGLKVLGVNITQGEVINDLITSHSSNGEKIYQVDDKMYTVEELCEIAFLAKTDGTVESYIALNKVKELVECLYVQLKKIEEEMYNEVQDRTEDELKQEYEALDGDEQDDVDLEGYKSENRYEKEKEIYIDTLDEYLEYISEQVDVTITQFKDNASQAIYDVPFEYLIKASNKSATKIESIADHFLPVKEVYSMMKGLETFRRYSTNGELDNMQVNYILKKKIGIDPAQYKFGEAIEGIWKLLKEKKIEFDVIFFVKMTSDIEENILEYSTNGVRLF